MSAHHSDVPHPGRWRTRHGNHHTDYEWIPDPEARADRRSIPLVPDARGVVWIDLGGEEES